LVALDDLAAHRLSFHGHLERGRPTRRAATRRIDALGTLAMFQVGGPRWKEWSAAMQATLPPRQLKKDSGALAGTWPVTADASPIGCQAKLAMCLEVYYRYDRVFGVK
jgi:hypothetical protein